MARKRRDGTLSLKLGQIETSIIAGLLDELDLIAAEPPGDDAVSRRLYVAGYADPDAAADFRDLTQASLQGERRDRYGLCRADLPVLPELSAQPDAVGELVIAPDAVSRWLMVINDMRLALGTRLGVTADGFTDLSDGDGAGADGADDVYAARAAYHWLTAVQDDLVNSAMR